MTPESQAALEKIKKLLRMKRGGTADEVETALRLAQELAARHGIDISSVDPDREEHERPIHHVDELLGARIQCECKYAALVCQQFFHVEVFARRRTITRFTLTFAGTGWDRQIAIYVYRFLCGHFRREWNTRRGRCRNRQSFMWGMYRGLCSKLHEQRQAQVEARGVGLIHVERALARRRDYVSRHFGGMTSTTVAPARDAAEASVRGWRAGRETEIRSGIKGSTSPPPARIADTARQPHPPSGQLTLL
jgi:hypothetical protein